MEGLAGFGEKTLSREGRRGGGRERGVGEWGGGRRLFILIRSTNATGKIKSKVVEVL